jgi:hypothetical protein
MVRLHERAQSVYQHMKTPENCASTNTHFFRTIAEPITHIFAGYEVIDDYEGIAQAESALSKGKALIICISHFSQRDAVIYVDFALRFAAKRRVPVVIPGARHQYDKYKTVIQPFSKLCDVGVYPVVIDDTKELEKYMNEPLGEGMVPYLRAAIRTVEQKGVVLSTLGGRRIFLDEQTKVLSTLLGAIHVHNKYKNKNNERKIDYVVLFGGLSPKATVAREAYATLTKWNIGMPYVLKIGKIYDRTFIESRFDLSNRNERHKVNKWGLSEFKPLVQSSYR